MDNPDVRTEVRRIMGYWLELGVAGFRVDAAPFLIESIAPGSGQPEMKFENQGPFSYERVNVEAQRRDPNSLLNWTAQMIRLRKECPEIGWGEWEILETGSPAALAMRYDWRNNSLILIHNFDERPHDISVKPGCEGGERLVNLLVEEQSQADQEGRHHLKLEAYGYRWYRVGGLGHIIRREKV